MATVNPIVHRTAGEDGAGDIKKASWHITSAAGDIGQAVKWPEHGDRTWHVLAGVAGTGVLAIEGCNAHDVTNPGDAAAPADADYQTLNNAAGGTALSF